MTGCVPFIFVTVWSTKPFIPDICTWPNIEKCYNSVHSFTSGSFIFGNNNNTLERYIDWNRLNHIYCCTPNKLSNVVQFFVDWWSRQWKYFVTGWLSPDNIMLNDYFKTHEL